MTQSKNSDQITINPAAAPLSRGSRIDEQPDRVSKRTVVFSVILVVLSSFAGWVFFGLPEKIEVPDIQLRDQKHTQSTISINPSDEMVPPYRRAELQRAEKLARESLDKFVELQIFLEDEMNINDWGSERYASAKALANTADQRFLERNYDEALNGYAKAATELESLRTKGKALYRDALDRGRQLLDSRLPAAAALSFKEALVIRPTSDEARLGAERATNQPKVLELMREAERARLRGDSHEAKDILHQAKILDPQTTGITKALTEIQIALKQDEYQKKLSAGFIALENGNFQAANAAFNDVLISHPEDAAALAGLQQSEHNYVLSKIEMIYAKARTQEDVGDWTGALNSYEAALDIDRSLQFARDGRQRVQLLARTIRDMEALIKDPFVLSENLVFTEANTLLSKAKEIENAGPTYSDILSKFSTLLANAAMPTGLVLISDNDTEITIHKYGKLGTFERREIQLRPGRYTIVGSRDGCRDVRKEIIVKPASKPVTIYCQEPL